MIFSHVLYTCFMMTHFRILLSFFGDLIKRDKNARKWRRKLKRILWTSDTPDYYF